MKNDVGFTHIALTARDIDASIEFYSCYANMTAVHDRVDADGNSRVVWLSDRIRPFVLVLIQSEHPEPILKPFAHLGVGCATKEEVDRLCDLAREEGRLISGPTDSGYPVGYWAFIRDPDGHSLEISYGQEVGLTVEKSLENAQITHPSPQ